MIHFPYIQLRVAGSSSVISSKKEKSQEVVSLFLQLKTLLNYPVCTIPKVSITILTLK